MKKLLVMLLIVSMTTSCGKEDVDSNVNSDGDMPNYEITELKEFSEYSIYEDENGIYIIEDKNYKYGYMDKDGNILTVPQYDFATYSDGIVDVRSNVAECFYADIYGNVIIDKVNGQKIGLASSFSDGYASVNLLDENGDYTNETCIINKNGDVVLQTDIEEYSFTRLEPEVFALVDFMNGKMMKVYNVDGSELPVEDYDIGIDDVFEWEGIFAKYDNDIGKYAIYDIESEDVITDYIFGFFGQQKVGENYLMYVYEDWDTKTCLIDKRGNILLDFEKEFGDITFPMVSKNNIFISYEDDSNKSLVLNDKGEVIDELNYYYIREENGTLICHNDRYQGYLDDDFNEILVPEYDYVGEIINGESLLVKDKVLYKFKIIQ